MTEKIGAGLNYSFQFDATTGKMNLSVKDARRFNCNPEHYSDLLKEAKNERTVYILNQMNEELHKKSLKKTGAYVLFKEKLENLYKMECLNFIELDEQVKQETTRIVKPKEKTMGRKRVFGKADVTNMKEIFRQLTKKDGQNLCKTYAYEALAQMYETSRQTIYDYLDGRKKSGKIGRPLKYKNLEHVTWQLSRIEGLSSTKIIKILSKDFGLPFSTAYRYVTKFRDTEKYNQDLKKGRKRANKHLKKEIYNTPLTKIEAIKNIYEPVFKEPPEITKMFLDEKKLEGKYKEKKKKETPLTPEIQIKEVTGEVGHEYMKLDKGERELIRQIKIPKIQVPVAIDKKAVDKAIPFSRDVHDMVVKLDDMAYAIFNRIETYKDDFGAARNDADFIMDIFGYEERIVDNFLNNAARQLFYMLEEESIVQTDREESILTDGKEWRTNYWILRKDKVLKYAREGRKIIELKEKSLHEKTNPQELYETLPLEIWNSRKTVSLANSSKDI